MQKMFVLRQKFQPKQSRATVVGILDENNKLKIAGAKCSNKIFNKKEGVKYALQRVNENPWVTINVPKTVTMTGKLFHAIAYDLIKNIDLYLALEENKAISA